MAPLQVALAEADEADAFGGAILAIRARNRKWIFLVCPSVHHNFVFATTAQHKSSRHDEETGTPAHRRPSPGSRIHLLILPHTTPAQSLNEEAKSGLA